MMENKKSIGIGVAAPEKSCTDEKCPFHGSLKVRGRSFVGKIISAKMRRTASFEFERTNYIPKYERYQKKRTRLKVHNPDCIDARENDLVRVMECRPLSKTKNFVIVEKITKQEEKANAAV
jgi:small subunit ribosomal protein S17